MKILDKVLWTETELDWRPLIGARRKEYTIRVIFWECIDFIVFFGILFSSALLLMTIFQIFPILFPIFFIFGILFLIYFFYIVTYSPSEEDCKKEKKEEEEL